MKNLAALILFLASFSPASADEPQKPVEEQIIEIVSSSKGGVRKWVASPKLAVIYRDISYEDIIKSEVMKIHENVPGFPGISSIDYYDLDQISSNLFGNVRYRIISDSFQNNSHRTLFTIEVGGKLVAIEANIFLIISNIEDGLLFGATSRSPSELQQAFAEKNIQCYFSLRSINDEIKVSHIFINTDKMNIGRLTRCLHEELTQSLGLLNDSSGSNIFTYNDFEDDKIFYKSDFTLLKSIYMENVAPGSSASVVVENYIKLSTQ